MTYGGRARVAARDAAPRPDVLAFPAPSIARFTMVAVVLIITGAFAGTWLHLEVRRDAYLDRVVACQREAVQETAALPEPEATVAGVVREDACRAGVERERAGYMLAGVLFAVLGGFAVVTVTPAIIERRRRLRALTPASAAVERHSARLAADLGLRRRVALRLGRADLGDAFSYGRPGDHRVALTRGLLVAFRRDPPMFDAVMRHELAHLRHGDVAWSTLASSIWYVVAPMLATPVVVAVFGPGRSLMPSYVWRAAVVAAAVHLAIAATLRDREYDADLTAAGGRWLVAMRRAVAQIRDPGIRPWYRRGPLALHPTPTQRLAVLDHPELAATTTFTDALVAGFLATAAIALLIELVWTALTGTSAQAIAQVSGALAAGALLGLVVGLALIRCVLVGRVVGRVPAAAPVALGVGIGIALGQAVSIAGTGTGRVADLSQPLWLLISFGLSAGATLVSAATTRLLAGLAGRARTARTVWVPAVVASTAAYTMAIWIALRAQLLADGAGVDWLLAWAVTGLPSPTVMVAGTVLTVIAAAALIPHRSAANPAWLISRPVVSDRSADRPGAVSAFVTGLAAGGTGAFVVAANRLIRGAAVTDEAQAYRFYAVLWIAAVAAAAATCVLCGLCAQRGPALAAVAGPVAVLVVLAGLIGVNLAQGLVPSASVLIEVTRLALGLAVALSLLAAAAALVGRRAAIRPSAAAAAAAIMTAVPATAIAAFPTVVVPTILVVA